jgi:hypothetical protein
MVQRASYPIHSEDKIRPRLELVREESRRRLPPHVMTFSPSAAMKLGRSLQAQGVTFEAARVTRQALGADAEHSVAEVLEAYAHYIEYSTRLGRLEDAFGALRSGIRLAARWGAHRKMAELYCRQAELYLVRGWFSAAESLSVCVLANMAPSDAVRARLSIVHAWTALRRGDPGESKVCALIASALDTSLSLGRVAEIEGLLGWATAIRGDAPRARDYLRSAAVHAHNIADDYERSRMMCLVAELAEHCDGTPRASVYRAASLEAWPPHEIGSTHESTDGPAGPRETIERGPWMWVSPARSPASHRH